MTTKDPRLSARIEDEAEKKAKSDYDQTCGFPSEKEWVAIKSTYAVLHGANLLAPLLEKMKEALEYYANEKNWYNVNKEKDAPIIKMAIGSIDTDGPNWIGGHSAREALAAYEKFLAGNK